MSYDDNSPPDDNIYRVCVDPETNVVEIQCIGINRLDTALEANYVSVDALPKWVQKKLALLMMTSPVPPTHGVEGVGRWNLVIARKRLGVWIAKTT